MSARPSSSCLRLGQRQDRFPLALGHRLNRQPAPLPQQLHPLEQPRTLFKNGRPSGGSIARTALIETWYQVGDCAVALGIVMRILGVEGRGIGMRRLDDFGDPRDARRIGTRVINKARRRRAEPGRADNSAPGSSGRRPSRWSDRARPSGRKRVSGRLRLEKPVSHGAGTKSCHHRGNGAGFYSEPGGNEARWHGRIRSVQTNSIVDRLAVRIARFVRIILLCEGSRSLGHHGTRRTSPSERSLREGASDASRRRLDMGP